MKLDNLNAAISRHGWFAEWASNEDDDVVIKLYRPQGGQAHDMFKFDPASPDDNGPWESRIFPADDMAVDAALIELCKEFQ